MQLSLLVGTISAEFFCIINPIMPNGISHHYQLEESILSLKDVGVVSFNSFIF